MSDDEGMDYSIAFREQFNARANTAARLKSERRAGMTSKQRAKRAKKTKSVNFRCSDEIRETVERLRDKLECDLSDVMEKAVLLLAEKELQGTK